MEYSCLAAAPGRVRSIGGTAMPASAGLSQDDPVRRLVATPRMTRGIDERFQKVDRVVINPLPVRGKQADHPAQDVGSQVGHPDPGRNKEAAVVGQEVPIPPARFAGPADKPIAAAQAMRSRRPGQRGHELLVTVDQVFQMLADRLGVTQIVMLLNQVVKERFPRSSPDLLEANWR